MTQKQKLEPTRSGISQAAWPETDYDLSKAAEGAKHAEAVSPTYADKAAARRAATAAARASFKK